MELGNIRTDEKIMILNQAITQLEVEIYRSCVMLGIDIATLDPATYTYETPVMNHEYVKIRQSLDSLALVKVELARLQAS